MSRQPTTTREQARDTAAAEHRDATAVSARIFDARVFLIRKEQTAEAAQLVTVYEAELDRIDRDYPEGTE